MKVRGKIWIEAEGEHVFGRGRAALLEALRAKGSIRAAAEQLDMSYRHAWAMINASEERLGRRLVDATRGGKSGGGARLTEFGRGLLDVFGRLDAQLQDLLGELQDEVDGLPG
ncbi:MAG: LysR family transcriptional regulator [Planctomycetes bacterium]|nr:LysR family transcriptional regulator [Planctomycetota bacterium]